MAGLLEEYGLDLAEYDAPTFEIKDDIYEFVVGDIYVRNGTASKPDTSWVNIEYLCGDEGKRYTEWFTLPEDASNLTDKERNALGYYKQRLISLGIPEEDVNTFTRDDVVGATGVLQLVTRNGFQNVRNLQLDDSGNTFAEPAKKEPAKPARKPAAPKAAPKAAPAPVEEEEEAVVEEAPAKAPARRPRATAATPPTVVANPFA